MKYDEIIKFLRQKVFEIAEKLLKNYSIQLVGGEVIFLNGRPEYKEAESDQHRYVLAWTWRDLNKRLDDPSQDDLVEIRRDNRPLYLFLTHNPHGNLFRKEVATWNPRTNKFVKTTAKEFDTVVAPVSFKNVMVHRTALIERLEHESFKCESGSKAIKGTELVIPVIIDLFEDKPVCAERAKYLQKEKCVNCK